MSTLFWLGYSQIGYIELNKLRLRSRLSRSSFQTNSVRNKELLGSKLLTRKSSAHIPVSISVISEEPTKSHLKQWRHFSHLKKRHWFTLTVVLCRYLNEPKKREVEQDTKNSRSPVSTADALLSVVECLFIFAEIFSPFFILLVSPRSLPLSRPLTGPFHRLSLCPSLSDCFLAPRGTWLIPSSCKFLF